MNALLLDSFTLWNLGYSDKAAESMTRAVALAERIRHATSIGFALCMVPMLHYFLRGPEKALAAAEHGASFAEKTNQPVYGSFSRIFRGWARSSLGAAGEEIEEIRSGISQFRATGAELFMTCLQCALCEAYRTANRLDDAAKVASAGLQFAEDRSEGFHEAELHRLQGLIVLDRGDKNSTRAEEHFARALEVARNQKSRSMELRISTDLARLWQRQGKTRQARELLAPIYDWFTEGFNTQDLMDAKALLVSLR